MPRALRDVTNIAIGLSDDAYLTWSLAQRQCTAALRAWWAAPTRHRAAARVAYRAALDREEAAARDLERLAALVARAA